MLKPNIVLLAIGSRDSQHRVRNWTRAARTLGLTVHSYPDRATRAVIPCTDHRVLDAAWMCHTHGIPGPDPVAATILTSKILAFEYLRSQGFDVLFSRVPLEPRDLDIGFSRPIIVKPERGSGASGFHDWAYRKFEGTADFRRYLARSRMERRFFKYQSDPHPAAGRYLIMEFVETKWLHAVRTAIGESNASIFDQTSFTVHSGTKTVESRVSGEQLPGVRRIAAMARAFGRIGFRRAILSIQCIRSRGVLQPIDFNFRTASGFDLQNEALGLNYYEQALAFLLGRKERIELAWPAPRVGMHRMYLRPRPGKYEAEFGPGCTPLITRVSYDPAKPYDYGHAWPAFSVACKDRRDFVRKVETVLAGTTVRRVR